MHILSIGCENTGMTHTTYRPLSFVSCLVRRPPARPLSCLRSLVSIFLPVYSSPVSLSIFIFISLLPTLVLCTGPSYSFYSNYARRYFLVSHTHPLSPFAYLFAVFAP